ncbi:transposable element Tc1 transposase [Trichonephila clavipes]|nr:transposable element Tc1 transposase [Trichonephila clavipes]
MGSFPRLGKIVSAFDPYCSGSINEYQGCLGTQTLGVSLQTDRLIEISAHGPNDLVYLDGHSRLSPSFTVIPIFTDSERLRGTILPAETFNVRSHVSHSVRRISRSSLPTPHVDGPIVPTTSGCFTRGQIIGKLEECRSVTSVAAEFGIAHSILSRLWRQFKTTGTAIRGFSSGRPRGTTPADDRYIVLQARRNRRQTAEKIARHTTQATGRPISRFTVARRLHGGGLFARRGTVCTFNACPSEKAFSVVPGAPELERQ